MISFTNYSDASGLTVFNTCFLFIFFYTQKVKQCDCSFQFLLGRPSRLFKWLSDVTAAARSRVLRLLCVTGIYQTCSCTVFHKTTSSALRWLQHDGSCTLERFCHIAYRCFHRHFYCSAPSLLRCVVLLDVTLVVCIVLRVLLWFYCIRLTI